jgi:hypothetical protein
MRRLLRRLTVFVGMLGVVMALNVGVAWAVHDGPSPAFGDTHLDAPSPSPVGSHFLPPMADHTNGDAPPGHPGAHHGFGFVDPATTGTSPAGIAIINNPNCPLHY